MQKAMVPLSDVRFEDKRIFSAEAAPILYDMGFLDDEECTYTTRVRVFHGEQRAEVSEALRDKLPAVDAERLISYLDAHDWDVSFFVTWGDC
jgi:hypothetical protein